MQTHPSTLNRSGGNGWNLRTQAQITATPCTVSKVCSTRKYSVFCAVARSRREMPSKAAMRGTTTTPVRKKLTAQPARPTATVGAPHGTWRRSRQLGPSARSGRAHAPPSDTNTARGRKTASVGLRARGSLLSRAVNTARERCAQAARAFEWLHAARRCWLGALRRRGRNDEERSPQHPRRRRCVGAQLSLTAATTQQRRNPRFDNTRRGQPPPRSSALHARQQRSMRRKKHRTAQRLRYRQRRDTLPRARSITVMERGSAAALTGGAHLRRRR